jgi:hypothetical protein
MRTIGRVGIALFAIGIAAATVSVHDRFAAASVSYDASYILPALPIRHRRGDVGRLRRRRSADQRSLFVKR